MVKSAESENRDLLIKHFPLQWVHVTKLKRCFVEETTFPLTHTFKCLIVSHTCLSPPFVSHLTMQLLQVITSLFQTSWQLRNRSQWNDRYSDLSYSHAMQSSWLFSSAVEREFFPFLPFAHVGWLFPVTGCWKLCFRLQRGKEDNVAKCFFLDLYCVLCKSTWSPVVQLYQVSKSFAFFT